jgi:hypothetical protein
VYLLGKDGSDAAAGGGTDPSIRRMAIAALARKNDPRTAKLLLDLVER